MSVEGSTQVLDDARAEYRPHDLRGRTDVFSVGTIVLLSLWTKIHQTGALVEPDCSVAAPTAGRVAR